MDTYTFKTPEGAEVTVRRGDYPVSSSTRTVFTVAFQLELLRLAGRVEDLEKELADETHHLVLPVDHRRSAGTAKEIAPGFWFDDRGVIDAMLAEADTGQENERLRKRLEEAEWIIGQFKGIHDEADDPEAPVENELRRRTGAFLEGE